MQTRDRRWLYSKLRGQVEQSAVGIAMIIIELVTLSVTPEDIPTVFQS